MISVDGSLLIQIVNFLFLIWVLNILLYKPIRKILLQRKDKISGLEQSFEKLGSDAAEKDQVYIQGVKTARAKGLKEKEALIQSASTEEKEIIRKINAQAQTELAEVRAQIAKDAEAVRQTLQAEVDEFAGAISQKILGRAV